MKRHAFLIAIVLGLLAHSAAADCTTYTVVTWQWTQWWDGSISVTINRITDYTFCDVEGTPPPPDSGGGSGPGPNNPAPIPPSVTLANVDTTDIYNPIVGVDVSSNDPNHPVVAVMLEVNGATVDFINWDGNARYGLKLQPISSFGDGNYTLNGKACLDTGDCGQSSASMSRFTPSPATADVAMSASYKEEECSEDGCGPVMIYKSYQHYLRQLYTTTGFSCMETGENSHVQVKDSLVTIAGHDPMPQWTAGAWTGGTITPGNYGIYNETPNPNYWQCSNGYICDSKIGSAAGLFGYSPGVHEGLWSFVIEGWNASYSGGSLDISLPQ